MYLPEHCITLDKLEDYQIRLGIQGYGGTGKTFGAATFPNPLIVAFDHGTGAHIGRADVAEVPVYSIEFLKKINPNYQHKSQLKDTMLMWLDKNLKKLEPDQTLVWDGGSGTQNMYHSWYENNKVVTKSGKEDDFAEWGLKIKFFNDLHEMFKLLRCHLVFICHEVDKKEKSGEYLGKVRPLLSGQFGDQIMKEYTDWFRQLTMNKPKDFAAVTELELAKWKMTREEYKAMCDSLPRQTIYYWKTDSDDIFDGKCSSLVDYPQYIPANYTHFRKWMRTNKTISQ